MYDELLFILRTLLFQDWLVFTQGVNQLTIDGNLQFENVGVPLEQDNFAFCKVSQSKVCSTIFFPCIRVNC